MTPSPVRALGALGALPLCVLIACSSGPTNTAPGPKNAITSRDIEQAPGGDPIEKVLQSKVPGIIVTRTDDGGVAIRIRGSSSFYSGSEPLYVIDDVPFNPGPGGALVGVNPYDIDTIKVLKDPADTGIYGMRGANGVVVITMKKPGKRSG